MAKVNRFGWSTKYTDEAGADYGGNIYNPSTGRWLKRDMAGEATCPNPYVFVFNNPLSYFDLLGLMAFSYDKSAKSLSDQQRSIIESRMQGAATSAGTKSGIALSHSRNFETASMSASSGAKPKACKQMYDDLKKLFSSASKTFGKIANLKSETFTIFYVPNDKDNPNAFVYPNNPFRSRNIYIVNPDAQVGTYMHEFSHLVAGTSDNVSPSAIADLANDAYFYGSAAQFTFYPIIISDLRRVYKDPQEQLINNCCKVKDIMKTAER